jgi:hypothetical protein
LQKIKMKVTIQPLSEQEIEAVLRPIIIAHNRIVSCRALGERIGRQNVQLKRGAFADGNAAKGGHAAAPKNKAAKIGIYAPGNNQKVARLGGLASVANKSGWFGLTPEQVRERGLKGAAKLVPGLGGHFMWHVKGRVSYMGNWIPPKSNPKCKFCRDAGLIAHSGKEV